MGAGSISAPYLSWYNIQANSPQGNFWHIKPRSKLGHLKSYPCATDTKIELAAVSWPESNGSRVLVGYTSLFLFFDCSLFLACLKLMHCIPGKVCTSLHELWAVYPIGCISEDP